MHIGIDASQVIQKQKTGVQWYAYHLMRELMRIVPPAHHIRLSTPQSIPPDLKPLPPHWEERILPWPFRQGWTLLKLAHELRKEPPDVFFSPGHIIPPFISCKTVVTIHDLGFREFPRAYAYPRLMNFLHKRDATIATKIIVPSKATKDAITIAYSVDPEKIQVIPHGYDADIYHPYDDSAVGRALTQFGIKKPYIISVGRIEEKKNILAVLKLVQAVRSSSYKSYKAYNDTQLVLVGTPGYGYRHIKQWINENRVGEWVKELGWLPSVDTAKLISGASVFITLSRAEGFGLTVLEAIACNTPVLASDIPAHREMGQAFIKYTNPDNLPESINTLITLINHDVSHALSDLHADEAGVEGRLTEFAWSHSAQQTLNVLISFSH